MDCQVVTVDPSVDATRPASDLRIFLPFSSRSSWVAGDFSYSGLYSVSGGVHGITTAAEGRHELIKILLMCLAIFLTLPT
jgi:hypothetical protein